MEKELLGSLELNRIYQMDCLEGMKLIPDESVDLILCDLPYGTTDVKRWDKIIPIEKLWEQYKRIIKETGNVVLFGSQPFTSYLVNSNPSMFRYEWIWDKTKGANFLNSNHQPLKVHENILVFSKLPASPNKKGTATYFPQKTEGKEYKVKRSSHKGEIFNGGSLRDNFEKVNEGRHPVSIQTFLKDKDNIHPTQKPVEMCEYLIRTYTDQSDIVLDNCMGSGTTAVASIISQRKWIGFETDPTFYQLANKRLEQVQLGDDLASYQ
ncbi:site-specific DNA-methyltransferase [Bacillus pumilus]|uniref:DNA-methyltransferase n=1 Tax=Bacillus TaxID=1386 RepID=UPI00017A5F5A|nr:site-specific DNA-methyltransferase [Bacillus pumilus]EDW22302.1 DNA methylase [Bacillus pumilus ATCC 7061]MCR4352185.1 site-specific DNA-methyltransferase [Bacillus pumilus]MCY7503996.1 site-specific DNA-methyltransferase [Bacillus pumilus]MDR4269013.1 site-specific DNA-methyltransferase [Bacillus pumilus]MDR4269100.1 site-specific DNA-methyltransferase [Bacillus pumilus]